MAPGNTLSSSSSSTSSSSSMVAAGSVSQAFRIQETGKATSKKFSCVSRYSYAVGCTNGTSLQQKSFIPFSQNFGSNNSLQKLRSVVEWVLYIFLLILAFGSIYTESQKYIYYIQYYQIALLVVYSFASAAQLYILVIVWKNIVGRKFKWLLCAQSNAYRMNEFITVSRDTLTTYGIAMARETESSRELYAMSGSEFESEKITIMVHSGRWKRWNYNSCVFLLHIFTLEYLAYTYLLAMTVRERNNMNTYMYMRFTFFGSIALNVITSLCAYPYS